MTKRIHLLDYEGQPHHRIDYDDACELIPIQLDDLAQQEYQVMPKNAQGALGFQNSYGSTVYERKLNNALWTL